MLAGGSLVERQTVDCSCTPGGRRRIWHDQSLAGSARSSRKRKAAKPAARCDATRFHSELISSRPSGAKMKSNSYLITKMDGTSNEILADHYEREGDEWVFMIGSREVLRIPIEHIASITKAGRST